MLRPAGQLCKTAAGLTRNAVCPPLPVINYSLQQQLEASPFSISSSCAAPMVGCQSHRYTAYASLLFNSRACVQAETTVLEYVLKENKPFNVQLVADMLAQFGLCLAEPLAAVHPPHWPGRHLICRHQEAAGAACPGSPGRDRQADLQGAAAASLPAACSSTGRQQLPAQEFGKTKIYFPIQEPPLENEKEVGCLAARAPPEHDST